MPDGRLKVTGEQHDSAQWSMEQTQERLKKLRSPEFLSKLEEKEKDLILFRDLLARRAEQSKRVDELKSKLVKEIKNGLEVAEALTGNPTAFSIRTELVKPIMQEIELAESPINPQDKERVDNFILFFNEFLSESGIDCKLSPSMDYDEIVAEVNKAYRAQLWLLENDGYPNENPIHKKLG